MVVYFSHLVQNSFASFHACLCEFPLLSSTVTSNYAVMHITNSCARTSGSALVFIYAHFQRNMTFIFVFLFDVFDVPCGQFIFLGHPQGSIPFS